MGINEVKDIKTKIQTCLHRVIIPLFIPNEEGYYKQAYEIFLITIKSILITTNNVKISVIANGCGKQVIKKLFDLFDQGVINELIIEADPIGKLNSLLKVLRTVEEDFVTVSDADVLFLNDWEKEVMNVFSEFPKAGAVCPTPVFRKHNNYTQNIWIDYLFSRKMCFTPVKNPAAMTRFANSIGWPWLDEKYKDVYLTLENNNGFKAMVGSSHFVSTYRKQVFQMLPTSNTLFQLGGNSEGKYLDEIVVKSGRYRLSTIDNYAYHMGNKLENWHLERFNLLEKENVERDFIKSEKIKTHKMGYFFKRKLYSIIFSSTLLKHLIYKFKGLSTSQIKDF
ncbi:glycosyltransferase family A protein [Neptunitalea chrysea]|uniref:glycosyltransferase family A protein n=1 Tax=Neptunitalea chrysea TaxID=1647581 RepID=UPI00249335CF|nr:glycosyltransferase family A protein [Neptunitalea chrysea]